MKKIFDNYWKHIETKKMTGNMRRPVLRWFPSEAFNEVENILFRRFKECKRILDIGAGDNTLKKKFIKYGYQGKYETFDVSKEFKQDYYLLEDIKGYYDGIIVLEVIEHLDLEHFFELFGKIDDMILGGAILAISTPNPACISSMWAMDFTHIQQYPLHDLLAVLINEGYECEAYRVLLGSKERVSLYDRFRYLLKKIITTKILGVDYAEGLLVIAKKK